MAIRCSASDILETDVTSQFCSLTARWCRVGVPLSILVTALSLISMLRMQQHLLAVVEAEPAYVLEGELVGYDERDGGLNLEAEEVQIHQFLELHGDVHFLLLLTLKIAAYHQPYLTYLRWKVSSLSNRKTFFQNC